MHHVTGKLFSCNFDNRLHIVRQRIPFAHIDRDVGRWCRVKPRIQRIRRDLVITELLVHAQCSPVSAVNHTTLQRSEYLTAWQSHDARTDPAPNRSTHAFRGTHLDALGLEIIDRMQSFVERHRFLTEPYRANIVDSEFSIGFPTQFRTTTILKPQLGLIGVFESAVQFGADLEGRLFTGEISTTSMLSV